MSRTFHELTIIREWEHDQLVFRLCRCDCHECAGTQTHRLLAAEVGGDAWLCIAYVPASGSHDSLVALDLEDPLVQDSVVHGTVLCGQPWRVMDAGLADVTAVTWETAPAWMLNADTDEVRGIRRWIVGSHPRRVVIALHELAREVTFHERPVKPATFDP